MRPAAPLALAFLLSLAACGDDPTTPGGEPGISFHEGYWIYRVRTNGEGLQRISPEGAPLSHWTPAPSPDGSKVAYAAQGAWEGGFEIMDIATGEVQNIPASGEHPRWSPDGSQIAYVSYHGDLRSVRPDGTGDRLLTSEAQRFSGGIDWSPDGAYVVAEANGGRLTIVEVATGKAVSVAIPGVEGIMSSPVWRPEAP